MIKVLIDTNVVLDAFLRRGVHTLWATKIIQKIDMGKCEGCISASTVTDLYYIIRKDTQNADIALAMIKLVYASLTILPVDKTMIRSAFNSSISDFEDAVQVFVAKSADIEIVITRDRTGFVNSGMTLFTPHEFLTYLESQ
ncbi:MAG: PIN domain-containing protein [Planctomycetaceae bacterium]|jgi:predicted nucleic acid-binding protein|nr:PIN domain-containing protein [Planctomycetaceae bacterium]